MDTMLYELYNNTKAALASDIQEKINHSSFCSFFTRLLEDCSKCVSQSLESAVELLCESNLNTIRLIEYIEDLVCLLRLMCNFIKNVVETVTMSCCSMTTFPTTTGNILVMVFKHCKESEQIYGGHLLKVGKQLKDLFRTCHELQIMYLMVLEKNFLFDLTKDEEQVILLNVLQINLQIGEIVQGLDVKTLAEQWKAYTVICEKHAEYLRDMDIFSKSTQVLCNMIENNIANSLEEGLDEKVVIRSLKVTSFIIKILLKVTNSFRNATMTPDDILEMFINIYINNEGYLELSGRSPQFINLIKANVLNPIDLLLNELLHHESFINCIFQYNVTSLGKDDKLLGFIMLLLNVIKLVLQEVHNSNVSSHTLIRCIFNCVPHCHIWFSMPLKFDGESINSEATYGLYECLLTHTAAISLTLNSEELCVLEQLICESFLSNDCWIGLFASNLWVLIARMSSQNLLFSQVVSLCRMYKKLEKHYLFENSPQQIQLSATITRLFELLDKDNKIKVLRLFTPIYNENNIDLWIALKISNIPWDMKSKHEEEVSERSKIAIDKFCTVHVDNIEIHNLIKIINLLATSSITADKIDGQLMKAWMRACLKNNNSISKGDSDKSTIWFLEYVQAITELTNSMKNTLFANPMNLIKILHVLSTLAQNGNIELKLYLIEPLCRYATLYKPDNTTTVESIVSEALLALFQSDVLVKEKLFSKLNKYMREIKMEKIISFTVNQDKLFKESWNRFLEKSKSKNLNKRNLKEHLETVIEFKYSHKCLENESELMNFKRNIDFNSANFVQLEKRKSSENFDFADVDDIFDNDSDSEPTSKKMKLSNEVSEIVSRLENDTTLLIDIKENIFDAETKQRLIKVCEKLNNIVY